MPVIVGVSKDGVIEFATARLTEESVEPLNQIVDEGGYVAMVDGRVTVGGRDVENGIVRPETAKAVTTVFDVALSLLLRVEQAGMIGDKWMRDIVARQSRAACDAWEEVYPNEACISRRAWDRIADEIATRHERLMAGVLSRLNAMQISPAPQLVESARPGVFLSVTRETATGFRIGIAGALMTAREVAQVMSQAD
jgi:hypothetical protein